MHNISAERHVGAINSELRLRGSAHLSTASRSVVCGQNFDLVRESEPGKFREFAPQVRPDGPVRQVLSEWNERQEEIEVELTESKKDSCKAIDLRRHKDLTFLQALGGPFTSADQVDIFIEDPSISNSDKEKR